MKTPKNITFSTGSIDAIGFNGEKIMSVDIKTKDIIHELLKRGVIEETRILKQKTVNKRGKR